MASRFDSLGSIYGGTKVFVGGATTLDYRNNTRSAANYAWRMRSDTVQGGSTIVHAQSPFILKGATSNAPTELFNEMDTNATKYYYVPSISEYNPSAVTATTILESGATTLMPLSTMTTNRVGFDMTFHAANGSDVTWTAMTAAASFLGGNSRHLVSSDLSAFTQCRVGIRIGSTAGFAGSKVNVRYYTASSNTASNFLAMGLSSADVSVNLDGSTSTAYMGAWTTLTPAARAEVFLGVIGTGGDGIVSPVVGNVHLQCR